MWLNSNFNNIIVSALFYSLYTKENFISWKMLWNQNLKKK